MRPFGSIQTQKAFLSKVHQNFHMKSSRLEGFYRKSIAERVQVIRDCAKLDDGDAESLRCGGLDPLAADKMVENAVGVFSLPLGIATNFLINDKDYLIPMVIE